MLSKEYFFGDFFSLQKSVSILNENQFLAGQRISNKLLKKKFFIPLFFSQQQQYGI
jgi:hypothetical protein